MHILRELGEEILEEITSKIRSIPVVDEIDGYIEQIAGGAGSSLGSGGMATKINAARIATAAGVDMIIMNGKNPEDLYRLFDGEEIGTYFPAGT